MKQNLTLRRWIIILTGFFFAVYSAYNIFIIVRDGSSLPAQGIFISAAVALIFAVFAAFIWTAGIKPKHHRILIVRRTAFILSLLLAIFFKLRLIGRLIAYMDSSKLYTVLYGAAFLMTPAGLLVLLIYYVFIRKKLSRFPRAAVVLPWTAIILFLLGFVTEAILFFAYGIGMESNMLRTVIIRPVFYLGMIGLCAYFLYPPRKTPIRK